MNRTAVGQGCSLPAVKVMACPRLSHRQQAVYMPEMAQAGPTWRQVLAELDPVELLAHRPRT